MSDQEYQQQLRRVLGLRAHAFRSTDPQHLREVLPKLAEEERRLQQLSESTPAAAAAPAAAATPTRGRMLGASTTQLQVDVNVRMHPLPTGIYHLLDPDDDPLVEVTVKNSSHDARRVRIRTAIEGLSAESVKTVELTRTGTPSAETSIKFQPTLLPGVVARLTEVHRATLFVIAEDLDGKTELHDTYTIVCLSRNSSFNAVRDPATGKFKDFGHCYGAWVTPYDELVQERIRAAAALCTPPEIWGYQDEKKDVSPQVRALFESLQKHGMTYVNSVIDYGAPEGYYTQRTRMPHESLTFKSANCIDGTVLMASMLEGASLNPAIVLVPGHAFVAWERLENSSEWAFLETTMMGKGSFEEAQQSGLEIYNHYKSGSEGPLQLFWLKQLRQQGIWPMA